jgi:regulatory protein
MAQSWRVKPERHKKPRPPLNLASLEQLGLFYVGRYATTRAKLARYLGRKVQERGWAEAGEPPIGSLVERFGAMGYVDDRAFAAAKASSLGRRGYGERRVAQALNAAGIDGEHAAEAQEQSREGAFAAALRFAERRRIGPYANELPDRESKQRAFAAMMRAGHPPELARKILAARPGEVLESDSD